MEFVDVSKLRYHVDFKDGTPNRIGSRDIYRKGKEEQLTNPLWEILNPHGIEKKSNNWQEGIKGVKNFSLTNI